MRKTAALAVAGALTAAIGIAGVAQAVNSKQTMDIKLAQNKAGTAAKPKSVGKLTVDLNVAVDPSDPPFATKSTVIHFDKNLVFGAAKFPSCTEPQARTSAPACTKAKVGSGSATGVALGQTQNLTVQGYNGPGGKTLLLRVKGSQPLNIDSLIVGKLQPDIGKFGKKLVVAIPDNLQQPLTNVYATLTHFLTTVGGSAKGTPYVGLKGCTGGKLQFKGDFVFTDGSKQSPTATVPCKK